MLNVQFIFEGTLTRALKPVLWWLLIEPQGSQTKKATGVLAVGSGLNGGPWISKIPRDLGRGPRHRLHAYSMYACIHNTDTWLWGVHHT